MANDRSCHACVLRPDRRRIAVSDKLKIKNNNNNNEYIFYENTLSSNNNNILLL